MKVSSIESFASQQDSVFLATIKQWLANASNAIELIVSDTVKARNQICIDDICLSKDQLRTIINNAASTTGGSAPVSQPTIPDPVIENSTDEESTVAEPEIIEESVPENELPHESAPTENEPVPQIEGVE